ncbi:MAG: prolipoprotein diacylglyceryl transferase [Candidatus Kerfeldbacteria bacterium RIFCSPLOWO2_01_FULL_48_11]|uniref:Phosphatidylglycerol--prolipoprotein diacylglyceryl transferase n=1 Tax=Candidatus Kerfeldbacteria bacterium RIFCSPLOWO2_01_FULL_48_11 TaxID=1798543 RepID=A0A1G2B2R2_9BACT|nr:MAG: Prolipoprotein diacylglyceryl transferase [Parcubacteria group bacterium GW2011_GWA2_48_9]KKW16030.1 MAG: Prolipoprotein diacylglyceryl transferase [Parcubacteria group bacterium GW2011_GWC2_49_9]OGY83016.1 MAG: prolipoprotein diacylglyceryl transferase [Candidatus Kerfeldbacteria bacterium RIFCSPLOWO2_01_FULL_48_11]
MFFGSAYPDPIVLQAGAFGIHWYSLLLVVAIGAGLLVTLHVARKKNIPETAIWDFSFLAVILSIVFGRFVFVVSYLHSFSSLVETVKVWEGGISSHGVLTGGLLAAFLTMRRHKMSFWAFTDVVIPGAALAQAIGRWGNYFNQEVLGSPSNAWWAVPIDLAHRPEAFMQALYFHPIWLYESLWCLLLFFCVYSFQKKFTPHPGVVTLMYFSLYYLIRFVLDFFRNDALSFGALTGTQTIAIGVWIVAVVFVVLTKRRSEPSTTQ